MECSFKETLDEKKKELKILMSKGSLTQVELKRAAILADEIYKIIHKYFKSD